MHPSRLSVLLVENDPTETRVLQALLAEAHFLTFEVTCAEQLSTALEYLKARPFDLILLDLTLPDSQGLETMRSVHTQVPNTSLIILTGDNQEMAGVQAVQAGAQDYLVKGQVTSNLLARAIRYAIERNRAQVDLRNMSWTDELTGLYNRHGFLAMAAQYLKIIQRTQKGLLLLYLDLDDLKRINERGGHQAGDQAILAVAQTLQKTFRRADILARLGGDEFAVLVLGAPTTSAALFTERLQTNIARHNREADSASQLSLSLSALELDSSASPIIEEWLTTAQQAVSQRRQAKQPELPNE